MLNRSITTTTTFRLSAVFAAVYVAGIVLLLGLVYYQTENYLTRRVDRTLAAEADNLERSGPDNILLRLRRDAAIDPLNRFGLFSASGEKVAGDTSLTPADLPPDGRPSNVTSASAGAPARALAQRMPWGETFIVERDTSQIAELGRIVFSALLWSGGLTAIFGLASSLVFSIRPLQRIRAMQAASDAITAGEFTRRLPRDRVGDELDALAGIANQMMDEAERLMLQARTVGEGVAHELRTPLTRLRALLDHACGSFELDDPRRRLLDQCVADTDVVLSRFQALLRIASIDSRGRHAGISTVSLNAILEQIHELYEPLAHELGVDLTVIAPNEAVTIRADGELLAEALSNLVDNALKFTQAGGVVVVDTQAQGDSYVLEVMDDGPGIPLEERSLVTKRFYRGHNHSGVDGHGLGLSVVASIADLHGFELSFHDAEPGTIVRINLGRSSPARGTTGEA